ncbi:hypothetical protein [Thalassotalea maritima]|uniref:hypothetical protein n=1 Tax=Thalassotalea maritima TaxID=3242416 RepID=UPI003527A9D2
MKTFKNLILACGLVSASALACDNHGAGFDPMFGHFNASQFNDPMFSKPSISLDYQQQVRLTPDLPGEVKVGYRVPADSSDVKVLFNTSSKLALLIDESMPIEQQNGTLNIAVLPKGQGYHTLTVVVEALVAGERQSRTQNIYINL